MTCQIVARVQCLAVVESLFVLCNFPRCGGCAGIDVHIPRPGIISHLAKSFPVPFGVSMPLCAQVCSRGPPMHLGSNMMNSKAANACPKWISTVQISDDFRKHEPFTCIFWILLVYLRFILKCWLFILLRHPVPWVWTLNTGKFKVVEDHGEVASYNCCTVLVYVEKM